MTDQIWYEDFIPGTVMRSAERTITLDDIDRFAALTGECHPVHMDEDFARAAGFPGRIAHGVFGLALIEGLKAGMGCFQTSVLASLGWNELRFHAPLLPGDTVHAEIEFLDRRPASKPGRGIATERARLIGRGGRLITSGDHPMVLACRPPSNTAAGTTGK